MPVIVYAVNDASRPAYTTPSVLGMISEKTRISTVRMALVTATHPLPKMT